MVTNMSWRNKLALSLILLFKMLSISACALCPPAPQPASLKASKPASLPASKAVRSETQTPKPLVVPTLVVESYRGKRKPLQPIGESIAQSLYEFKPRGSLCSSFTTQNQIDALEQFAGQTVVPILPLFAATLEATKRKHPGFKEFLSVAQQRYGEAYPLDQGLAWLATLEMLSELCGNREPIDEKGAAMWSSILLHFATSEELLLQTVYAAFEHIPQELVDKQRAFFWAAQPEVRSGFSAIFSNLLNVRGRLSQNSTAKKSSKRTLLLGATAKLRAGFPHLQCDADVSIQDSTGPALRRQGSILFADTFATLAVRCTNVSNSEWMISESLLVPEPRDACVYDLSGAGLGGRDFVLPELQPGQSTELNLGPILISADCEDKIRLGYKLVSSYSKQRSQLDVQIPIENPELRLSTLALDEDLPGHSVEDKSPGLGPDDRAELRLKVNGLEDFDLRISHLRAMDDRIQHQFHLPGVFVPAWKAERVSADDIDFQGAPSVAWYGSARNVAASDTSRHWMLARLKARNTCSAFARYMPRAFQNLYRATCTSVKHQNFVSLVGSLQTLVCEERGKRSARKTSSAVQADPPEEVLPVPNVPYSKIIDPTYPQVVAAVHRLIELNALSSSQLDDALQHLDALVGTPLFTSPSSFARAEKVVREKSRRLILAELLANAQAKHLDPEEVDVQLVLRNDAEKTLGQVQNDLIKIELRGEMREMFARHEEPVAEPTWSETSGEENEQAQNSHNNKRRGPTKTRPANENEATGSSEPVDAETMPMSPPRPIRALEDQILDAMSTVDCDQPISFPQNMRSTHLVYRRMFPVPLEQP